MTTQRRPELVLDRLAETRSVRGSVLRGLAEEHGALDLRDIRRANEEWLREVATDARAGVTKRALLVTSRNDGVRAMNDLAREAVRGRIGESAYTRRISASEVSESRFAQNRRADAIMIAKR